MRNTKNGGIVEKTNYENNNIRKTTKFDFGKYVRRQYP